jgi:hypothetical protein
MSQQRRDVAALLLLQVELPLGATEDRICGTIDIEQALTQGVKAFEPGLLVRGELPGTVLAAVAVHMLPSPPSLSSRRLSSMSSNSRRCQM